MIRKQRLSLPVQVELNTIASSFGPLSAIVSRLHEYTVSRCVRSDMVWRCHALRSLPGLAET
jgi:Eukaryotic glutathione synthase, ATP binding domain